MDGVVTAGHADALGFVIDWDDEELRVAEMATGGRVEVYLSGDRVWPPVSGGDTGFDWSWIELLEFFGDSWPSMLFSDGLPDAVEPMPLASDEWAATTQDGDSFRRFRRTHDLSTAIQGADLPSIWVVPEGQTIWILTANTAARFPRSVIVSTLTAVGDAIADRLDVGMGERAKAALSRWQTRHGNTRRLVIARTALSPAYLRELHEPLDDRTFWDIDEEGAESVMLAAARMAGALPPAGTRALLDVIRSVVPVTESTEGSFLKTPTPPLESLLPFEEGYELALWYRSTIDVGIGQFYPRICLAAADVSIVNVDFGASARAISALAVWASTRKPTVVLNSGRTRSSGIAGERFILAHELCHLIVDRDLALPLMELLGGRVRQHLEQRANAFAAELLLPRNVAGLHMLGARHPQEVLGELMDLYVVGEELAAWQIYRSNAKLAPRDLEFIRSKVSRPLG